MSCVKPYAFRDKREYSTFLSALSSSTHVPHPRVQGFKLRNVFTVEGLAKRVLVAKFPGMHEHGSICLADTVTGWREDGDKAVFIRYDEATPSTPIVDRPAWTRGLVPPVAVHARWYGYARLKLTASAWRLHRLWQCLISCSRMVVSLWKCVSVIDQKVDISRLQKSGWWRGFLRSKLYTGLAGRVRGVFITTIIFAAFDASPTPPRRSPRHARRHRLAPAVPLAAERTRCRRA